MRPQLRALLDDDEDPLASAVNLVDVFLVLVAALLAALAMQAAPAEAPATVQRAGAPDMELVTRENGQELRYRGEGQASAGNGVRAGTAWRLDDGSIVYVPEAATAGAAAPATPDTAPATPATAPGAR